MADDIAFVVPVRIRGSASNSWDEIRTVDEAMVAIFAIMDRDESSKPLFDSTIEKLDAALKSPTDRVVMEARDAVQQALIVYGIGDSPVKRL